MPVSTVLLLASIGVLSLFCQWLAWRVRMPAILFLLAGGIASGPVLGYLNPEDVFGDLLFPMVSLAVAIILFEGSLTLRFAEIRGHGKMVRNLLPIGAIVTGTIGALSAHYILGISWEIALLFGAISIVTGPTVIAPLLRSVRPSSKLANILQWEGIIIDPIGALLAVLVFEGIVSWGQGNVFGHSLYIFAKTIAVGALIGAAAGYLNGQVLRKHWIPQYLHNAGTLTFMLGVYALSNELAHESGLLTVTIMGLWMANMKQVPVDSILEFKESLSVLLISALFIILAARIEFSAIADLGWGLAWVLAILMLIARPLSIFLSAIGTSLNWREKLFLSWIAPRGIVAAAVSALFAFQLQKVGYEGAGALVPLVFMLIIATVTIQSLTARPLANLLNVTEPAEFGFLILGANPVARMIGLALKKHEVPVVLADTNWENVRQARMENLQVYFGNPVSEHASNQLDLTGVGNLLVISPYKHMNSLATYHFLDWFGDNSVYSLAEGDQDQKARHQTAEKIQQTRGLFNGVSYAKLASLASQGYSVKTTELSDEFSYQKFLDKHQSQALVLFMFDGKGRITPVKSMDKLKPDEDSTLISLVPARAPKERKERKDRDNAEVNGAK
ncbi:MULTISPECIES: sodium:proton antiporter [unclassified Marinobacter]|jgi:NhaP-type Na+/H+ or K+/H+ antiporter|uniref:cation:proton antiporter n=1 Tax=unclassified Marinobacter TaxID=83889 RepID=UPI00200DD664|nr:MULTISPECIES: sodium:proton antiporter [unclassified Marinobacter]MCL1476554.1 sodium:proton antiporter [Marinobacter sp.]MCL1481056.1 sodium:proton antiporter [Marinobacter sp.]MCL1483711.1 sodium:proton antiporter [Marinobacter sp.]MCL1486548.1 sodium:proton antiporter [Marinobacter sp.]UQG56643.1 sodium:proton antiporter [Marinobacter sp. M4C]